MINNLAISTHGNAIEGFFWLVAIVVVLAGLSSRRVRTGIKKVGNTKIGRTPKSKVGKTLLGSRDKSSN